MTSLSDDGILQANANTFLYILTFWSILESFIQSDMFENNENNYYSIISLKMDAKKYALSNYYWKMFLRYISLVYACLY